MPRTRSISDRVAIIAGRAGTVQPVARRRPWWGVIPVALAVLLFALRGCLHVPPLERLAPAASEPADPPGTVARAGSLAIERGGPTIVGFDSPREARLVVAGQEVRGAGVMWKRIVLPHGAAALRFAAPDGARLVWNPVGRRGAGIPRPDYETFPPWARPTGALEYVSASSLSPDPPERATFEHPGTDRSDGWIAMALVAVLVGTLCMLARKRLAAVSRDTWFAMAGVVLFAFAVRLIGLSAAGQTWDEDVNWTAGRNYITNLLALDFSQRSWSWNYEHPPVMKLLDGIGAQLTADFTAARVLSALWISLGCALLVPIGQRLYRLRVGILAAVIAALLPPLIAHGKIVGHESPTVLWWALGIVLALGVHDYLPSDDRRALRSLTWRLAGVGAVVGIAIASRLINGLLGPLVALIVVVQAPDRWRRATIAWGAAILPVVAVATFVAVWPRLWSHPIEALAASFGKLSSTHSVEPFLGSLTAHPPPYYFALYLVVTLPLGVLLAVIAWLVRTGIRRERAAIIVGAWFVIPLAVVLSPVRQDGVRYVMPCVLCFAIMAAAGLDALADWLRRLPRAFLVLALLVCGYLALVDIRTHPYYLDYFGEQVGGAGTVAAHRWFETAWWGEGIDRAVAYVNDHAQPGDRIHRNYVEVQHVAWFREDLWANIVDDPAQARWIVVYAPATHRYRIPPAARRVFAVEHAGATLAEVYERREDRPGASFPGHDDP